MQLPLIPRGMHARAWPPVLATRGPGGPCAWHSHHSLRFALALEGEVRIRTTRQGKWASAPGVLTAADAAHMLDAQGAELLLVFLDPESVTGTPFLDALNGPVRLISDVERNAMTRDVVPQTILRSGAAAWARQAAETLRLPAPAAARSVHPRVRALLSLLRNGGVDDATSLEGLARAVGLSPSRLMHVFTSSVGIPLRPYLGWLRVQRAAIDIVSGNSLTDAAIAAGFSDAAHMSRTFRRMLGIPPSLLRAMKCSS
jgi:AraC-like DNA-binding protein